MNKPEGRKVLVQLSKFNGRKRVVTGEEEGYFETWGMDHEEFEDTACPFSIAIYRDLEGNVKTAQPTDIRFV